MTVDLAQTQSGAPFQIWAPDVYQGAPAPVSAFLSVGPKAAAFAVLLRVFLTAFGNVSQVWMPFVWGCALATMIVGVLGALAQATMNERRSARALPLGSCARLVAHLLPIRVPA